MRSFEPGEEGITKSKSAVRRTFGSEQSSDPFHAFVIERIGSHAAHFATAVFSSLLQSNRF